MTDTFIVAAWQIPDLPQDLFHNAWLLKDLKTLWCPLWTAQGELQFLLIYLRARVEKLKSCTWKKQKRGSKGRQVWKPDLQRFSLTRHHWKQCQSSELPQEKWLAIANIMKEGGQVTALQQLIPSSNFNKKKRECLPFTAFIFVLKVVAPETEGKETEVRHAGMQQLQKIYEQLPRLKEPKQIRWNEGLLKALCIWLKLDDDFSWVPKLTGKLWSWQMKMPNSFQGDLEQPKSQAHFSWGVVKNFQETTS